MRNFRLTVLIVGAEIMLAACASMAPPQPPSLDLPKPPADLHAVRKGDKVELSWTIPTTTTDRRTIRRLGATRICRGTEMKLSDCGTPVASVRPSSSKPSAKNNGSYSDLLASQILGDDPHSFLTYAVEVLNEDGRGAGLSNQVQVSTVRTLPPPGDFKASVTGQGVVLSWTGKSADQHSSSVNYVDRIYRRLVNSAAWTALGSVPVQGGGELSFTDSNIEWEQTYAYRAETVTVIAEAGKPELQIDGDDTAEIKVFAHDVFPPAVPAGLQAVFSGPGQQPFVDLIWAPVSDIDLDGYNVYRHEEGLSPVKLNAQVVKVPAYRDMNVQVGRNYFYSVSAVDVRGNESARSDEASERVP